jgi:hypothetical protein
VVWVCPGLSVTLPEKENDPSGEIGMDVASLI